MDDGCLVSPGHLRAISDPELEPHCGHFLCSLPFKVSLGICPVSQRLDSVIPQRNPCQDAYARVRETSIQVQHTR